MMLSLSIGLALPVAAIGRPSRCAMSGQQAEWQMSSWHSGTLLVTNLLTSGDLQHITTCAGRASADDRQALHTVNHSVSRLLMQCVSLQGGEHAVSRVGGRAAVSASRPCNKGCSHASAAAGHRPLDAVPPSRPQVPPC